MVGVCSGRVGEGLSKISTVSETLGVTGSSLFLGELGNSMSVITLGSPEPLGGFSCSLATQVW